MFTAYPDLKIVHHVGRVHSGIDPISRLRRNIPLQEGSLEDKSLHAILSPEQDSLADLYEEISLQFKARNLQLATTFNNGNKKISGLLIEFPILIESNHGADFPVTYITARSYNLVSAIALEDVKKFSERYGKDNYFKRIQDEICQESNWSNPRQPLFTEKKE